MPASYALGFDIGGTFTDFVRLDLETGAVRVYKVLTDPQDPARGVLQGLNAFMQEMDWSLGQVEAAVHSTTLITNAVIERKGAPTALLTTKGFRDILAMGREQIYDIYELFADFPEPLVPRHWRHGIAERMTRDGVPVQTPDPDEVRNLVRLLQGQGIQSLAVGLLHSYRNPAHERAVKHIIADAFPDLPLSLSSEIAPVLGEYERLATTVVDAYVKPLVAAYLAGLSTELARRGYRRRLYLMLSAGGTATADTACEQPVRLLESGPAAGALAAGFYGHLTGVQDLLSFDMGGTTAKACLLHEGRAAVVHQLEVARVHRFKKGSGMPVVIPVMDMIEIGAGGGSLAWIDELGLLKVGPPSAGASPGPACYGLGGRQPTVTDALLLLGYLNPDYFLGGRMPLDLAAARQAVAQVATPLQLSETQAAWAIYSVVNENMAAAARIHLIEKGKDPRRYTMVAFGGAGPAHAGRVARLLGMRRVIIPLAAGVTSALGCLAAPLSFEFVRAFPGRLDEMDWGAVAALFAELEHHGRAVLHDAGVPPSAMTFTRAADMRLVGQIHEITIPLPVEALTAEHIPAIQQTFYRVYRQLYSRAYERLPIQVVNWRLVAAGPTPSIRLERQIALPGTTADAALKGYRRAYFPEAGGFVETPVYNRYRLVPGVNVRGPAILEERESTVVIGPKDEACTDEYLNLVVQMA
ncbi:MAG TPA: hydantoinase/oxoprolinase family protein [Alphaproteobacteria bacterium]|nr:hydantoinase/oxoprolinase family protein [Alphaproteobacteria bacterium]